MDWKSFIANVIGSLAWPVVAGVTIYVLRSELAALLRRIRGAKIAGTEVEFDEALEKAQEGAEIVASEHPEAHQPIYFLDERKLELANKFPAAAIMGAYKEVEEILLKLRERLDLPARTNLRSIVRRLVENELVDAEVDPFFKNFQQARNAAVHATDKDSHITPGRAIEYLGQARLLASIFTDALQRLG
jgi:hypothetical protein